MYCFYEAIWTDVFLVVTLAYHDNNISAEIALSPYEYIDIE